MTAFLYSVQQQQALVFPVSGVKECFLLPVLHQPPARFTGHTVTEGWGNNRPKFALFIGFLTL